MYQNKTLIIACLLLTACLSPDKGQEASPSLAPIAEAPTEPITEPEPTPEPSPWLAPTNAVEAGQQFPGDYTEVDKPANTLAIDSAGNVTGYSETTGLQQMPNGQWITVAKTCTFTGHSYWADDQGTGYWTMWYTMDSASHTADQSAYDCEKMPTNPAVIEVTMLIRFVDENCIAVRFDESTGDKTYCRQ
jgi:hypothetical protein